MRLTIQKTGRNTRRTVFWARSLRYQPTLELFNDIDRKKRLVEALDDINSK